MKIRLWLSLVIMFLVLTACTPVAAMPTDIQPTSTETPAEATKTSTPTEIPIEIPTSTPTSIPTLEGLSIPVPDPRISNPELFDLRSPDAPIPQFVNAMKMAGIEITVEQVVAHLKYESRENKKGEAYVFARTSNIDNEFADGIALLMAKQSLGTGEWQWLVAKPGEYWRGFDKYVGLYLAGDETKDLQITKITSEYFKQGILSLNGQVRPGPDIEERRPRNSAAIRSFELAKSLGMALNFHYVVEPGKFPKDASKNNIDEWLHRRLSEIADVLIQYKLSQPVLIEFNEPWHGNGWNPEPNPLKDKYGKKWLAEYVFQTLDIFISKGLVPSRDFVLLVNDDDTNPRPVKQRMMHEQLIEARREAFGRLISDSKINVKLIEANIIKAEDIEILLGVQGHITLGNRTEGDSRTLVFEPEPTVEQLNALADYFGDLGGVILTEVNPTNGNDVQKRDFLAKIMSVLASNQNLRGLILWNLFRKEPGDVFLSEPLLLFDPKGTPSQLYFEFLKDSKIELQDPQN